MIATSSVRFRVIFIPTLMPPPRDVTYGRQPYDDRRMHRGDRKSSPSRPMRDTRDQLFNTRSVLAQNLVNRGRALCEGKDHDAPSGSIPVGPECLNRYIRATEIPKNFMLATGISKFTGESKPEIWLEDYRVAVQIGGSNDDVAMKHLPLMLEGSARAWLN